MPTVKRRLRGLKALIHDAVDATTRLVDEGHESTSRAVRRVTDRLEPVAEPARGVDEVRRFATRAILATIRGVNRGVEAVTDAALDLALADEPPLGVIPALPLRSDVPGSAAWIGDAALGLLNGAIGNHLEARTSGLDLEMFWRARDCYVPLEREAWAALVPEAPARVALFVHGLMTTEWSWCLEAEAYHGDPALHFGSLLERDLGILPVHLRYNSGRRVSRNGRDLADQLERFVDAYPGPLEELVLIGHSMGGLVLRSASHYGTTSGHRWPATVKRAFYLGSPHRGAPLARLGDKVSGMLDAVDHPATQVLARLLEGRSEGIHDLRHGALVDDDWLVTDPDALTAAELLPGARHTFFSATITEDSEHPLGRLIGDLLVQTPSASGPYQTSFPIETRRYGGILHHQLQNHPAVYAQLRDACAEPEG